MKWRMRAIVDTKALSRFQMEEKVGIITSYLDFDKNYGGVLQGYALSKIISSLGYTPYIMPYVYQHITDEKISFVHRLLRSVRKKCTCAINSSKRNQNKSFRNIKRFVDERLPIYPQKTTTIDDLKDLSKDFHAFVCGSDQVWNVRLQRNHCDPGMFLSFVPDGIKRIAYAPSLGSTTSIGGELVEEFQNAIARFHSISVRERGGQDLIMKTTGRFAPIVLDPTLLMPLEWWNDFLETPEQLPPKYILLYRFGSDMESTDRSIVEAQRKYGLPIIELPSSAKSLTDGYTKRYDIDPAQFIGIIKNASLVLTDSFHCTVFCILMRTQFLTFYRQSPEMQNNMNDRVDDLLQMTQLTSRLIKPGMELVTQPISEGEFSRAYLEIAERKKASLTYLREALK